MTWKYTAIFEQSTNLTGGSIGHRIAGWSESIYAMAFSPLYVTDFYDWCRVRAQLLCAGAAIVGQRFQQVDPVGGSSTSNRRFPGQLSLVQDVPQMALFWRQPGLNAPNSKPITLRGIPDDLVKEGEYKPFFLIPTFLQQYCTENARWQFRGRDLTQTNIPLISVDANGLAETSIAHPYAANDRVRVLRTMNVNGKRQGGVFTVIAPITTFSLTFRAWNLGATLWGKLRKEATIYPYPTALFEATPRVIVRKVGRPFGGYRGRASTRR